jgi:hypothetical protein
MEKIWCDVLLVAIRTRRTLSFARSTVPISKNRTLQAEDSVGDRKRADTTPEGKKATEELQWVQGALATFEVKILGQSALMIRLGSIKA